MTSTVSLAAARALAIHAQRLDTPNGAEPEPTPETIDALVHQLGCVQIDTLHVVARAHYLTLWSRLGSYDTANFDRLLYDPERRTLFEYWGHAASILPLREYRHRMALEHHRSNPSQWWDGWLRQDGNQALAETVLARVREEGPLRVADFEYDGPKRGSWWDWKPAKVALEFLFISGELMVTRREKFQRVYDVRDRVLPEWVDRSARDAEESTRFIFERSAQALGIATDSGILDYTYYKRKVTQPIVRAMVADGTLVEVATETMDGKIVPMLVHRDTLPLLEQAQSGALKPGRTTFLNFFDSLFWGATREVQLWGYNNMIEAYKHAEDRIYGYFCLAILHNDRIIGRLDPVVDRKKGLLRLKALYLEPGVKPDEELIAAVATAMRDFMAFHGARDLAIEKSQPAAFGKKLLKAL